MFHDVGGRYELRKKADECHRRADHNDATHEMTERG
jgi:hypothetical protein